MGNQARAKGRAVRAAAAKLRDLSGAEAPPLLPRRLVIRYDFLALGVEADLGRWRRRRGRRIRNRRRHGDEELGM